MTPRFTCRIAAATALLCFASTAAARQPRTSIIDVAPPTGAVEVDRASIIAALEQARPGDTIQFAPGTYLVGRLIPVATSRLTLRGHAGGTVLRGCEPAAYDAMEREFVGLLAAPPDPGNPGAAWDVVSRCGMMEFTGGHVTIRDFTFEYGRLGLLLGCCGAQRAFRATDGGYLIEGNTFRNSGNSIRAILSSPVPTVIRDNRFINTFHALSAVGSHLHFVDNHVAVTDPAEVPGGLPGFGISISSVPPDVSTDLPAGACDGNVIARNHVEGHPNGIFLDAAAASVCTGAEIRDNTIIVRRGPYRASWPYALLVPLDHPSDSTIVGVPLTLWGESGDDVADGRVTNSVVEGNRIVGAEGVGMDLRGATQNRIVNNTISGVLRREPYPGNLDGPPPQWGEEHNGSGIWVSVGSVGNEITGNVFHDVASYPIVVEGDSNRVETRSPGYAVRDLGRGNLIRGPADRGGPAGDLQTAGFEDYREPIGRMQDGVLRIALDARPVAWQPWGPDGATILAHAFAADGEPPRVPGPLIRVTAGTPVHVTVRNSFEHPLVVRGLQNRPPPQPGAPPPLDSLVVAAGATAEVRFTPLVPITSIFAGVVQVPPGSTSAPLIGGADEANRPFVGMVIVDPPDGPQHEERFFIINHWGDSTIPSSFLPATRFFVNGRSWPHTERLEYEQGDTVRWRVINFTGRPHPMHLHGFYFRVDARGDLLREHVFTPDERRLAVTELLQPTQTMRITWVPEEPGNWIFHCHFMRHMSAVQNAPLEGAAASHHHGADSAGEDLMGGLVLGITVRPGPDYTPSADVPRRRLPLHIGMRAGVFDDAAGYGFVLQQGPQPPAADSVRFPGSTLVLTRGEPTEIVVHNRADVPLGVHWHGLELESWADGVPGWSGMPGSAVPAIPPGDSLAVRMTPPRAGTFMYHVHSEPGHQLAQGLYGAFLVLEPGEGWDRDVDHAFMLGSLGAGEDAPAAVNGQLDHGPVELRAGVTHRLRFMHMSPDDDKRVFLLADGEPVQWRHVAKDGADLPATQVRTLPADLAIHVGETYDFLWTPPGPGDYTLRIVTTFDRGAPAFPRNAPAPHTQDIAVRVRRAPIIDMHLHAAAIRSAAHADSVLEWMDRHGVARAMMLVHDTAGLGWRERAPDRFLMAVSFPCHEGRYTSPQPCLPEWSGWPDPEWLRRQHAAGRLDGLGELLNVYYGMSPADERLAPYFALAEELDIPVGVHTGRGPPVARRAPGCCPNFDDDYGDPALLGPLLRRHPKLRVWLMHAGGPFLDEAVTLMRAFPNVYADMSILNSMAPPAVEAHSLRAFLDAGLGDRIMLGTDNLPLERILERMDAFDFLSEAQRRAILYDNAARFLRLGPDEIARDHEQAERSGTPR